MKRTQLILTRGLQILGILALAHYTALFIVFYTSHTEDVAYYQQNFVCEASAEDGYHKEVVFSTNSQQTFCREITQIQITEKYPLTDLNLTLEEVSGDQAQQVLDSVKEYQKAGLQYPPSVAVKLMVENQMPAIEIIKNYDIGEENGDLSLMEYLQSDQLPTLDEYREVMKSNTDYICHSEAFSLGDLAGFLWNPAAELKKGSD